MYKSCFAGDDALRGCSMYRFRFADDRQEWSQLGSTRKKTPGPDTLRIDRLVALFLIPRMVLHGRLQVIE